MLASARPVFSVEFFPPKTEEGRQTLFETVEVLRKLDPHFFSVTYGAGGATREGTLDTTRAIRDEYGSEAMAHLSCVGETVESLREIIDRIADAGIDVPIIPGVMPMTGFKQIGRISELCEATIPAPLASAMEALDGDERAEFELGVAYATQQCADLLRRGAPGVHLYALNRWPAARAILGALHASRPWEENRSGEPAGAGAS